MRKMLLLLLSVCGVEVVISMTKKNGKTKLLNMNLRLVNATDLSSKSVWSMDKRRDGKYRFRKNRKYLAVGRGMRLFMKNGGILMKKLSNEEKLGPMKAIIDKKEEDETTSEMKREVSDTEDGVQGDKTEEENEKSGESDEKKKAVTKKSGRASERRPNGSSSDNDEDRGGVASGRRGAAGRGKSNDDSSDSKKNREKGAKEKKGRRGKKTGPAAKNYDKPNNGKPATYSDSNKKKEKAGNKEKEYDSAEHEKRIPEPAKSSKDDSPKPVHNEYSREKKTEGINNNDVDFDTESENAKKDVGSVEDKSGAENKYDKKSDKEKKDRISPDLDPIVTKLSGESRSAKRSDSFLVNASGDHESLDQDKASENKESAIGSLFSSPSFLGSSLVASPASSSTDDAETDESAEDYNSEKKKSLMGRFISMVTPGSSKRTVVRGPNVGFVFELIPIFKSKTEKGILIVNNGRCLSYSLEFEKCNYSEYWDLDSRFFWDIYRTADFGYLNMLKSYVAEQEKKAGMGKASVNCMPTGNCQDTKPAATTGPMTGPNIQKRMQNGLAGATPFLPALQKQMRSRSAPPIVRGPPVQQQLQCQTGNIKRAGTTCFYGGEARMQFNNSSNLHMDSSLPNSLLAAIRS